MSVVDRTEATASRNIDVGGYGSRIALAEPVIGRAFARPVGSLVRDDVDGRIFRFNFQTVIPGWCVSTRPQMRNCESGNLEIPGSMLRIAPE